MSKISDNAFFRIWILNFFIHALFLVKLNKVISNSYKIRVLIQEFDPVAYYINIFIISVEQHNIRSSCVFQ